MPQVNRSKYSMHSSYRYGIVLLRSYAASERLFLRKISSIGSVDLHQRSVKETGLATCYSLPAPAPIIHCITRIWGQFVVETLQASYFFDFSHYKY